MQLENDGSLIIYFQSESLGKDKESNWLRVPNAPFFSVLRIYGPREDIVNGTYDVPQMIGTIK